MISFLYINIWFFWIEWNFFHSINIFQVNMNYHFSFFWKVRERQCFEKKNQLLIYSAWKSVRCEFIWISRMFVFSKNINKSTKRFSDTFSCLRKRKKISNFYCDLNSNMKILWKSNRNSESEWERFRSFDKFRAKLHRTLSDWKQNVLYNEKYFYSEIKNDKTNQ